MAKIRLKQSAIRKLLLLADAVLLAAFLIASFFLVRSLIERRMSRTLYEEAAAMAVSTPEPATPTPDETPAPSAPPTRRTAPEVPIEVDFEKLATESRYIRGWLYSAGTPINYPLVQRDNNEFYLTHSYQGSKRVSGAIFFDCRNAADLSDQNLILYGHHMADDSMFGTLLNYVYADDYYGNHPIMYLITPMQDYRIELFAARSMNSDPVNYPVWFASEEEHRTFINRAIKNSEISADTEVADGAQAIMLVTCTYTGTVSDKKFILYGELVPLGV